jgi:hypothetical protein
MSRSGSEGLAFGFGGEPDAEAEEAVHDADLEGGGAVVGGFFSEVGEEPVAELLGGAGVEQMEAGVACVLEAAESGCCDASLEEGEGGEDGSLGLEEGFFGLVLDLLPGFGPGVGGVASLVGLECVFGGHGASLGGIQRRPSSQMSS